MTEFYHATLCRKTKNAIQVNVGGKLIWLTMNEFKNSESLSYDEDYSELKIDGELAHEKGIL